jgi:flagellar hook assembly protein FlgD
VKISYAIPKGDAKVSLTAYDLTGRTIRTIFQGERMPGVHEATWDGCGENGNALRSGIYFLRLTTERTTSTTKLTLVE